MIDVDQARREVEDARHRLKATAASLKARTRPQALVAAATADFRKKAQDAGTAALDAGRSRPGAVAAIGLAALALIFRKPLMIALRRRRAKGVKNEH